MKRDCPNYVGQRGGFGYRGQHSGIPNRYPPRGPVGLPHRLSEQDRFREPNRLTDTRWQSAVPGGGTGEVPLRTDDGPRSVLVVSDVLSHRSLVERESLCLVGIDRLEKTDDSNRVGSGDMQSRSTRLVERITLSWVDELGYLNR